MSKMIRSIEPTEHQIQSAISVNDLLSITYARYSGEAAVCCPFTASMKIDFDRNISPQENYESIKHFLESIVVEIFTEIQRNDASSFWTTKMREVREKKYA